MHKLSIKYSVLLAVISGVLTGLVFPLRFGPVIFPNLGFLVWFSLVPLFVAIQFTDKRNTFLLTFISAFIWFSISFSWLYNALTRYGHLSPAVSIVILFLMMVVLGSYHGVVPVWVKWIQSKWKIPALFLLPVAWTAQELCRSHFPAGGFPWNNLAYSQYAYPLFIQTADLFSVYGITFLIILVNYFIAEMIVVFGSGKRAVLNQTWKAVVVVVLFSLMLAYGGFRLSTIDVRSPAIQKVRVAIVQGNIPEEDIQDEGKLEENLETYRKYMGWTKNSNIELTIWPESSYPYIVPRGADGIEPEGLGLNVSSKAPSWLLFGALGADIGEKEVEGFYNSAVLVDNVGKIRGWYHKNHLVPFGEYVPLRRALFFVGKLVSVVGDLIPGTELKPLVAGQLKIGPLICYEDIFPEIARGMTIGGARLLVNITNDAWYGFSSAAYQHMGISVFRAVENRRYLLRAANTGVSAVINPKGAIEMRSQIFEPSFAATTISLFDEITIYDYIGDLLAYLFAGIVGLLTIARLLKVYSQ